VEVPGISEVAAARPEGTTAKRPCVINTRPPIGLGV